MSGVSTSGRALRTSRGVLRPEDEAVDIGDETHGDSEPLLHGGGERRTLGTRQGGKTHRPDGSFEATQSAESGSGLLIPASLVEV